MIYRDPTTFPLRRYGGAVWARCNVRKHWKCYLCRRPLTPKTSAWFPIVENGAAGLALGVRMCQPCMKRRGHTPERRR